MGPNLSSYILLEKARKYLCHGFSSKKSFSIVGQFSPGIKRGRYIEG